MKGEYKDQELTTYHGDWSSWEEVAKDFAEYDEDYVKSNGPVKPDEVLFAGYYNESYSGSAKVIFRQGELYHEVHSGHCSCYGLEGSWEPTEGMTKDEFIKYLEKLNEKYEEDSWYYNPNWAKFVLGKLKNG